MCAHTIVLEVTGYSLCVWGREREREKRKNVAIIKIKASSWHLFPRPFQPLQGLKRCRENNPLNRNWKLRQRVGTSDLFLSRGSNPFDSSPLFIPVTYRSSIGIFSSSSYSHSLLQRIGRVIVQESKDRLEEAQNRIDEIEIFRGRQTRRFDYATNNLFFFSSFVPYFFRFLLFDHPRVNARALLFPFRVLGFTFSVFHANRPTEQATNQPVFSPSFRFIFLSPLPLREFRFSLLSSPLVRGDHDSSRISLDWKGIRSSYPIVYGNFVHNNSREIVSRSRIIYRKF